MKEKKITKETKLRVKFGLLAKLLIGILVPLVIILAVVGLRIRSEAERALTTLDTRCLSAEAESASKAVDAYFQRFTGMVELAACEDDLVQSVANWPTYFDQSMEQQQMLAMLKGLESFDDSVVYTWLCNVNNKQFYQSDGMYGTAETFDITQRKWYAPAVNGAKTVITGAYKNLSTDELIVTIASPVYANGQLVGILGMDVLLDTLGEQFASLQIGETGYVIAVDSDNNIIYHPDKSLLMKNVGEVDFSANMREIIQNKQIVDGEIYQHGGETFTASTAYAQEQGYYVLGVLPEAEYQTYAWGIRRSVIFWFSFATVILVLSITLISLFIVKSVKRLSEVTDVIAEGDLNVQTNVKTNDEVGHLAKSIDAITDRLREYIEYINEITQVLQEIGRGNFVFSLHQDYRGEFAKVKEALLGVQSTISETLSTVRTAASQVASGADQVSNGAQSQAQGATEQASSVQELASTLNDVSRMIAENSTNIARTGEKIAKVSEDVRSGEVKMQSMLRAMDAISENSKKVGNIIKSIEDIAFQTNILALNAAVEAARAGQAGKGFAVVADEVRSLAGKTAEASKSTAELIEKALNAVENGKLIADETAVSFEQVYKEIGGIADQAEEIVVNSANQDEAIHQTAIGVEQISSVVQTNSATAEESAAASEELSGQAQMLQQLINGFRLPADRDGKL